LFGKIFARKLEIQLNLPLLLATSIVPDIDLALRFLEHRGPTHSLITAIVLTSPFLFVYGKTVLPYFSALVTHSLIGDFFTGGAQLLWPFSTSFYGLLNIAVTSFVGGVLELFLFFVSVTVMFKTGDIPKITGPKTYKPVLLLLLPAVLIPMLSIGSNSKYALPLVLAIPSIFYIAIFAYSLVVGWRKQFS
jgi:membrane-bound metal-dependent hydrolase YbcI (DUF457 family)